MAADRSSQREQDHVSTPRWVKVLGVGALLLALVLILLMLTQGPNGHGPGRHLPFGASDGELPQSSLVPHEGWTRGVGPVSPEDW